MTESGGFSTVNGSFRLLGERGDKQIHHAICHKKPFFRATFEPLFAHSHSNQKVDKMRSLPLSENCQQMVKILYEK